MLLAVFAVQPQGVDNYHTCGRGLVIPLIHFRGAETSFLKRPAENPHYPKPHGYSKSLVVENFNDTQTGMLLRIPRSARCVQRFDDSLNSAIHITYRISLRSSSMREPRDPLLKVVHFHRCIYIPTHICRNKKT